MASGFTIDIVDECEPAGATSLSDPALSLTVQRSRLFINASTNFAINHGHGFYYSSLEDVPSSRAAYFDISTRSLIPLGDL